MGYDKNGKPTLIPASQVVVDSSSGKTLKESIDNKELGNNVKSTLSGGETNASPSVAVVKSELDKRPTTQQVNSELSRRPTTQQVNEALDQKADKTTVNNKQDKLVSGQNIKTVGGMSILGSGDIPLPSGSGVNITQTVNPSDTANAPSCKAVADYVAAHAGQGGSADIVEGDNVKIENLPNGKKRISAQLAGGTAQAASEVSYDNGDGTQTSLQNKVCEIDNRLAEETTPDSEEEMAWTDEENGETYAKVNKNGIFSKAFFYMDGSPVGGGRNITNKNILAIGDSITDYATWTTALISKFGCHVYNRGVHGSTFGDYLKPNGEEDDVPSIIDRLEMAAYNGSTHNLGFPDAANVDIVCVMAGINDWGKGRANHVDVAFGELNTTSDVRTFCGGVKTALFSIAERYYNKKLFLILPTHVLSNTFSYWNEIAEDNGAITILKDKENKTYNDYRAVIRYYGLLYGYHILDSFESGLNALIPINNQTYYKDGLHPNAEGGSILADFIGNNLINNI